MHATTIIWVEVFHNFPFITGHLVTKFTVIGQFEKKTGTLIGGQDKHRLRLRYRPMLFKVVVKLIRSCKARFHLLACSSNLKLDDNFRWFRRGLRQKDELF